MKTNENRIEWIDMAKGLAVLMVILQHVASFYTNSYMNNILSTLHNPTFYMASGFLVSLKLHKNNFLKITIDQGVKLIMPFIMWVTIYSGVMVLFCDYEIKAAILDSANKLWFLPILYIGIISNYCIEKIRVHKIIVFIGCGIFIVILSFYSSLFTKIIWVILLMFIGKNLRTIHEKRKRY